MMKKNLLKALFPFASLSLRDIKHWKAVKVSQSVFYLLMTLIVVVYALFFLVGYEHPYDENPDFNAPLLTGVLITFVLLLLLMAVAVTLFAVYKIVAPHAWPHRCGQRRSGLAHSVGRRRGHVLHNDSFFCPCAHRRDER